MKNKLLPFFHALMVAFLVGFIIIILGNANPSRAQSNQNLQNVAPTKPSKKMSLGDTVWEGLKNNLSLSYYVQLLGGTLTRQDETYNAFTDNRSPIQTFHAVNLKYSLPKNYSLGVTLAGVRHHSGALETKYGYVTNDAELFNIRTYLTLPWLTFKYITIYNTLSYEFASSEIAKENKMKGGVILSQSYALNLPYSSKFSAGVMTQFIRYFYENNNLPSASNCLSCQGLPLQTVIFTMTPYVNYALTDRWKLSQIVAFDWDQRGAQTGTTKINNNLPDRMRTSLNYYPSVKYFTHIGVFLQPLLKAAKETTAIGADMSFKF